MPLELIDIMLDYVPIKDLGVEVGTVSKLFFSTVSKRFRTTIGGYTIDFRAIKEEGFKASWTTYFQGTIEDQVNIYGRYEFLRCREITSSIDTIKVVNCISNKKLSNKENEERRYKEYNYPLRSNTNGNSLTIVYPLKGHCNQIEDNFKKFLGSFESLKHLDIVFHNIKSSMRHLLPKFLDSILQSTKDLTSLNMKTNTIEVN